MKLGVGLTLKALTGSLRDLINRHPNIKSVHILEALEKVRETITEEAIARSFPELRKTNPLDKRAPNAIRPQQKRPPEDDYDRPVRA